MKKLAFLALLTSFTVSAFTLETKAIISNSTQFNFTENDFSLPELVQKDSLTASFRQPLNESGKTYFAAEGLISFEYDRTFSDPAVDSKELLADLSLFKFSSLISLNKANLNIALGRFSLSDVTSCIFNQNADGLLLQYLSPYVELSAYGAYTGLLNNKTVTLLDPSNSAYSASEEKDFYDFSPAYITGALTVKLPYLLLNQSITAEAFAFIKSQGPSDVKAEDDTRLYATLAFNGPLASSVFYTANTSFLFSETYDYKAANLTSIKADIFPTDSFMLSLKGLYASGENSSLKTFTGFTSIAAGFNVSEKKYSSLAMAGLECAGRLSSKTLLNLKADALFDMIDSKSQYSGTQILAAFTYQAFTDLNLSLEAKTFIADKKEESKTSFALLLSLAL